MNIVEVLKRIGGESVWQAIGLRQLQEPAAQIDKAAELAQKWAREPVRYGNRGRTD